MNTIRERLAKEFIAKNYSGCTFIEEGVVRLKTPQEIWRENGS